MNGINATISLPLQKHLPLPENEKSRSTAANGKRLHTRSHPGKFFYVNVGAFVESDHVKKIEDLLRAEHLNFTTETVTSVVPVYRIRVGQFPSTAPADALAEKLKTYGYSPSRGNSGSMHNVYVGPYYSQNDVKTDRAVIAAAIPSAITETTKESAQLTVFQIGGYAWRESAEEVRARLLETGMVDESLIRELSQRD